MQKSFYHEKLPLSKTTTGINAIMELNDSHSDFHVRPFSPQVFLWANAWEGVENTFRV